MNKERIWNLTETHFELLEFTIIFSKLLEMQWTIWNHSQTSNRGNKFTALSVCSMSSGSSLTLLTILDHHRPFRGNAFEKFQQLPPPRDYTCHFCVVDQFVWLTWWMVVKRTLIRVFETFSSLITLSGFRISIN